MWAMNHWTPPHSELWTYARAVPPYWVRKETNGDCMSEHGVHEWRLAGGSVYPGVLVPSAHTCSSRELNGVLPSSYLAVVRQQRPHWPLMGPFLCFPVINKGSPMRDLPINIQWVNPSLQYSIHSHCSIVSMYWAAYSERNTHHKIILCLL